MRQISDTMRTAYAYDFTVSYYYVWLRLFGIHEFS